MAKRVSKYDCLSGKHFCIRCNSVEERNALVSYMTARGFIWIVDLSQEGNFVFSFPTR